ncbi:hypothetical protein ASPBRDRAFT_89552, partial [Aspergillus brasiliensis CBS 101740]
SHMPQRMHTKVHVCDVAKELRAPFYNELLLTPFLRLVGSSIGIRFASHARCTTEAQALSTAKIVEQQKHSDDKHVLQALRTLRK